MSAEAEALADWLVEKMHPIDGSTLIWRKDGKTIVYFDFESPAVFIIRVDDAVILPRERGTA